MLPLVPGVYLYSTDCVGSTMTHGSGVIQTLDCKPLAGICMEVPLTVTVTMSSVVNWLSRLRSNGESSSLLTESASNSINQLVPPKPQGSASGINVVKMI